MVNWVKARTEAEIVDVIRAHPTVKLVGSDSCGTWRRPVNASVVLGIESCGVIEHDVEDQVVVVSAGATIAEVQQALRKRGQCIPLGPNVPDALDRLDDWRGSVAGQLSLNLPHSLQAECGSWRDWVLGLTIVRPDGTVCKCGSKAVKSVAGYDVAKLFIGARGTLGVISQVILRTFPIRGLPQPDFNLGSGLWSHAGRIQRTLSTDFEAARIAYGDHLIAFNSKGSTLYISCDVTDQSFRYPGDWQLGWGLGEANLSIEDPTVEKSSSKDILLNYGVEALGV